MLARVERPRETKNLLVDAVDLPFAQYFHDLAPTYTAWRRLTLEARTLMESYRDQTSTTRLKERQEICGQKLPGTSGTQVLAANHVRGDSQFRV